MSDPTLEELVAFRDRFGLEAYLVWCCAIADLPAWMLLNFMKIGRHFGNLPEDRYDREALSELVLRPMHSEALTEIIGHVSRGDHISLELVREVTEAVGTGNGGSP